jgi:hypothetical protein
MSRPEYRWRQLTPKQSADLLAWRKERGHPWHSPPHRPNFGHLRFHVTAACFEHQYNPVHPSYVARWTDWPWSSAPEYLARTNPDEAKRIWHEYPLGDYGKGWDEPEI